MYCTLVQYMQETVNVLYTLQYMQETVNVLYTCTVYAGDS